MMCDRTGCAGCAGMSLVFFKKLKVVISCLNYGSDSNVDGEDDLY